MQEDIKIYGNWQKIDILCIAPHPDDAEIGAGGTLLNFKDQGYKTAILELTAGEMGSLGTPKIRLQECIEAAKILNLDFRGNLRLKDGEISDNHKDALLLAKIIRILKPKILIIPHFNDRHPDHYKSFELCKRAIHKSSLKKENLEEKIHKIKHVFLYQGNNEIEADYLIEVKDLEKWKLAILAHKSQFSQEEISETVSTKIIERRLARLTYWGTFINKEKAEAFSKIKPLLLEPWQVI